MVRIWLDGLSVAGRSTSPPNSDGKRRRESRTGSSVISEISDVKQGQQRQKHQKHHAGLHGSTAAIPNQRSFSTS